MSKKGAVNSLNKTFKLYALISSVKKHTIQDQRIVKRILTQLKGVNLYT